LTAIAQTLSRAFHSNKEERITRRWRFSSIVFYGSILAALIVFAALSQPSPGSPSSRDRTQASLLSLTTGADMTPSGEQP